MQSPLLRPSFEEDWAYFLRRWNFTYCARWAHYGDIESLPDQGWKIHVSCVPSNAQAVAEPVIDYLMRRRINFKIYKSISQYMKDSIGLLSSYSQKGKFITIYPRSYSAFLGAIAEIGRSLKGLDCYAVPFDENILGTPVHYRYGSFKGSHIVDPNGVSHKDDRFKKMPDWMVDPLEPHLPQRPGPSRIMEEKLKREYRIVKAIQQRARGGNYLAKSADGSHVMIKEGRRLADHDQYGRNGMTRVYNDWWFNKEFQRIGVSVVPIIDSFSDDNRLFIVQPFINTIKIYNETISKREEYCADIALNVDLLHREGYFHGDIKVENILFTNGKIFLSDFETSGHVSWDNVSNGRTSAYEPIRRTLLPQARDRYALGVLIASVLSGISPIERINGTSSLTKMCAAVPNAWRRTVTSLLWRSASGAGGHHRLQG